MVGGYSGIALALHGSGDSFGRFGVGLGYPTLPFLLVRLLLRPEHLALMGSLKEASVPVPYAVYSL